MSCIFRCHRATTLDSKGIVPFSTFSNSMASRCSIAEKKSVRRKSASPAVVASTELGKDDTNGWTRGQNGPKRIYTEGGRPQAAKAPANRELRLRSLLSRNRVGGNRGSYRSIVWYCREELDLSEVRYQQLRNEQYVSHLQREEAAGRRRSGHGNGHGARPGLNTRGGVTRRLARRRSGERPSTPNRNSSTTSTQ